jgi:hypothetical protein
MPLRFCEAAPAKFAPKLKFSVPLRFILLREHLRDTENESSNSSDDPDYQGMTFPLRSYSFRPSARKACQKAATVAGAPELGPTFMGLASNHGKPVR